MTPVFDRGSIIPRILTALSHDGPASLDKIFSSCGAVDGGQQYFVRQELKRLLADCKIRRNTGDLYTTPSSPEQLPAADMVPASEETQIEHDTQPAREEKETMQTQTNGSTGYVAAKKGTATSGRPQPLQDFIIKLLRASDGLMSGRDVAKAAVKAGVTGSKESACVTMRKLTRIKRISNPALGMYAADAVFDASKERKKLIVAQVTNKTQTAKKPPKKIAAAEAVTPPAKAGRKPSLFRSVYVEIDQKISEAKSDEKAAAAGVNDIDAQIEGLKTKRSELVAKRDAARAIGKKLDDSRKRIVEVEAGVAESLKA